MSISCYQNWGDMVEISSLPVNFVIYSTRPVNTEQAIRSKCVSELQLRLRNFQRSQKAHRLVLGFLAFAFRDAVRDDAGSGLHVRRLAEEDHRAQGNTGIHVTAEIDIADSAARSEEHTS